MVSDPSRPVAPAPADPPEPPLVRWVVAGLTVVVVAAVAVVLYVLPHGHAREPGVLPTVNAALNGTAALLLVAGFAFIRARRVAWHRACMTAAFTLSSLFLVTYLAHHLQSGSVRYEGQGLWRAVYFALLIPHVVLAVPVVPLALFTLYRGLTGRIALHRRVARFTLPIWLYVSASGVAVYAMLYL